MNSHKKREKNMNSSSRNVDLKELAWLEGFPQLLLLILLRNIWIDIQVVLNYVQLIVNEYFPLIKIYQRTLRANSIQKYA